MTLLLMNMFNNLRDGRIIHTFFLESGNLLLTGFAQTQEDRRNRARLRSRGYAKLLS